MKDKIKEILNGLNVVIKHGGSVEINSKECKKIIDYITNLQEENEQIRKMNLHAYKYASDMEGKYLIEKSRCENAQDLILNELSHLKAKDEETWNKEFYDENNKLDYRKLCIELLSQVANLLDGGDKE